MSAPQWRPASNGAGARHWFLVRDAAKVSDRYHYSASGQLVHYGSAESAQTAADRLNAGTEPVVPTPAHSAEYGAEVALGVEGSGCEIRTPAGESCLFAAEYVRIVAADGREVGYWDSAEWASDPIAVMGAILGAASGIEVSPIDPEPKAGV